jgi:ribonuclease III
VARQPVLERRIGHRFKDPALLAQALTHRSFGSPHNERLEFLGDGVIACVVAEALYVRFPDIPEGKLHLLKTGLVRETALARVARGVKLSEFLRLGAGESSSGGADRASILADAMEAVYGAVFLDAGYAAVQSVVRKTFGEWLEKLDPGQSVKDAKTRLQELLQGRGKNPPEYRVVSTAGVSPRQIFEVECLAAGVGLRSSGSGGSRRIAEQQAAAKLLEQIEP